MSQTSSLLPTVEQQPRAILPYVAAILGRNGDCQGCTPSSPGVCLHMLWLLHQKGAFRDSIPACDPMIFRCL
jgi:hypothetical protein